jgi:hypothetical protein
VNVTCVRCPNDAIVRGLEGDDDLLARLTAGQLRALRVLHQSGWLYKEAAFRLGVPEATVRTTVHRALLRAGATDRAQLAYSMGAADQRRLSRRDALRAAAEHATLAGTTVRRTGALGCVGRSVETTR